MRRTRCLSWGLGILCMMLVAGCTPGRRQLVICPGKANVAEALAALGARAEQAVAVRSRGAQCRLYYYDPDKEKQTRHKVALLLWFAPPSYLYIQGSVGVDQKAVIVGSNAEEFWLALRPKEIDAYYWGRWDEAGDVEGLIINPRFVLEGFGVIVWPDAADSGRWSLENEGPYDILTLRDEKGSVREKVYVYACEYLVHKIEYFNPDGSITAVTELEDYTPLRDSGFEMPKRIRVTTKSDDGHEDLINVRFSSWEEKEMSDAVVGRYLIRNPSDMDRFEHVYRYEDGQWMTER